MMMSVKVRMEINSCGVNNNSLIILLWVDDGSLKEGFVVNYEGGGKVAFNSCI